MGVTVWRRKQNAGCLTEYDCQLKTKKKKKQNMGSLFGEETKNAGGLTEDDDQVLKMSRTPCPKMSRTPGPVEDPWS